MTSANQFNSSYVQSPVDAVWSRAGGESIAYSDGDQAEAELLAIVSDAEDVSFGSAELMREIRDWPTLYHLAAQRGHLLQPFEEQLRGASVLELGGGCGAISRPMAELAAHLTIVEGSRRRSRILAHRCRDLNNVSIVCDRIQSADIRGQFDVVTLIGVLEYAGVFNEDPNPIKSLLELARKFVKPDGMLILAIENQLGLKYFSGVPEDHTGLPMYGISGHYTDSTPRTFGRHSLARLLRDAGFPGQTFYYPFPDYKVPRIVVYPEGIARQDDYDLSAFIRSALTSDPLRTKQPSFSIERTWDVVARNHLVEDMAHSFLVAARLTEGGPSKQPEEHVLLSHSCRKRKPEYCKVDDLTLIDDVLVVSRRKAYPNAVADIQGPVKQTIVDEPYIRGTNWRDRLVDIMNEPDWRVSALVQWAQVWLDQLLAAEVEPGILPADYFDAIPANMIVPDLGAPCFIDLEWEFQAPLALNMVVFRGLLSTLSNVSSMAPSIDVDFAHSDVLTMTRLLMGELGLKCTDDFVTGCFETESELQGLIDPVGTLADLASRWASLRIPVRTFGQLEDGLGDERDDLRLAIRKMQRSPWWRLAMPLRAARSALSSARACVSRPSPIPGLVYMVESAERRPNGTVHVTGWCFASSGRPHVDVAIRVGEHVTPCRRMARTDVISRFAPKYGVDGDVGFVGELAPEDPASADLPFSVIATRADGRTYTLWPPERRGWGKRLAALATWAFPAAGRMAKSCIRAVLGRSRKTCPGIEHRVDLVRNLKDGSLVVSGWCFSNTGEVPTEIRVRVGDRVLQCDHVLRPDVLARYGTEYGVSGDAGYEGVFELVSPWESRLPCAIEAVFANGRAVELWTGSTRLLRGRAIRLYRHGSLRNRVFRASYGCLSIHGVVESNKTDPIRALLVSVGGRTKAISPDNAGEVATGIRRWATSIPIEPGFRLLTIRAKEAAGNRIVLMRRVIFVLPRSRKNARFARSKTAHSYTATRPLTDSPAIDVVIVTYNSASIIEDCLASIAASNYDRNRINVIVVDNASTDESVATVRRFAGLANLKLIDAGGNVGFGRGCNLGAAEGCAPYVLFLNSDARLRPETLATMVQHAEDSKQRGFGAWEARQRPVEHPKLYDPRTQETEWASGACVLVARHAFEEINGFDPKIFLYGEDVDLSWRLRRVGHKIQYIPEALVDHDTLEGPMAVKPAQFLGSVVSNGYLRWKFGTLVDILAYPFMLLKVLVKPPPRVDKARRRVFVQAIRNVPKAFGALIWRLKDRRKDEEFGPRFVGWDYEYARLNPFFVPKQPADRPLVSVIVRTMARPFFLNECLQSLRNQTYPNMEVVVVEDGPATSQHVIDQFQDMNILYIATGEHVGRCEAGNIAMNASSGKYLNFLDEDDLFYAHHIETLVGEMHPARRYYVVYAVGLCVQTEILSEDPFAYRERGYDIEHNRSFDKRRLQQSNFIPINAAMFSRELFEDKGGLDPELDILEDWDLWLRYAEHAVFRFVPTMTHLYRVPFDVETARRRQEALATVVSHVSQRRQRLGPHYCPDTTVACERLERIRIYVPSRVGMEAGK